MPGKPKIDRGDPAAKDALVSVLVSDANALVAAFNHVPLDEPAASAPSAASSLFVTDH